MPLLIRHLSAADNNGTEYFSCYNREVLKKKFLHFRKRKRHISTPPSCRIDILCSVVLTTQQYLLQAWCQSEKMLMLC